MGVFYTITIGHIAERFINVDMLSKVYETKSGEKNAIGSCDIIMDI
jgi:hypothetical protein